VISFNAAEIYEMAEQIERNGAAFYRKAAEGVSEEGAADLLLDLAAMEDDHEKTFAEMKAQLSERDRGDAPFDPDNEGVLYLRSMVEGKVFDPESKPAEKLTGSESLQEILHTAIGLEKDSIVFYIGMKKVVPDNRGRQRIDDIIAQEMGHITTLSGKLAAPA